MRYRQLSADGDYTFGQGQSNFLVNSPEAVGQLVKTRLLLLLGEWFLDVTDGTPYATDVLGVGTQALYDQAIRNRILTTQDSSGNNLVTAITSYGSNLNTESRELTVIATINTIFGATSVNAVLP